MATVRQTVTAEMPRAIASDIVMRTSLLVLLGPCASPGVGTAHGHAVDIEGNLAAFKSPR